MKLITKALAASALVALAACNQTEAGNNTADNAAAENGTEAATENGSENLVDGKPVANDAAPADGNAVDGKPAADEAAPADGEAGEKPTE